MKVNIISRKLIKPCTPTPQNLSKYKISLTDELSPQININVILFYPPNPKPLFISHLEESLAKTLPQFYPLAGRYIKKDLLVDCNDKGAEFAEGEATDIELMMDLKTKSYPLYDLLSRQFYEIDMATDPMLSIQITRFKKCGGLAIGISVPHRIFDASSLATFIEAWSINTATGGSSTIITPIFDSPSLFPCRNLGNDIERPRTRDPAIVVKSFLFNKEDITNLRSKIRPKKSGEEKVFFSRVRLVSVLIAKALIRSDRAKYGMTRDCFIMQPVNMRGRTISRVLPQHSCGNLVIPSVTRCDAANHETNAEIGFEELIYVLGDAIHKTIAQVSCLGKDGHNDDVILDAMAKWKEMMSETRLGLLFTDWSKFGFYEADLGWGKPIWAGIGTMPLQHVTKLMSNKEGDGIEAWVQLNRADMPCFERCLQIMAHEMESEQD